MQNSHLKKTKKSKKSNKKSPQKIKRRLGLLIVAVLLLIPFLYTQNHMLTLEKFTLKTAHLPQVSTGHRDRDGVPYRLVHLSDLHSAWFGKNQDNLVSKVKSQIPDHIFITGDLIDSKHYLEQPALVLVQRLSQIAPVYVTLGNHEAWTYAGSGDENFVRRLEGAGAVVLRNEGVEPLQGLEVVGIDDPDFGLDPQAMLKLANQSLKGAQDEKGALRILLSHRPELFDLYGKSGESEGGPFDLVLSGHAHGGQVRLPWLGGLVAPNQGFWPRYDGGAFTHGPSGMTMIVNRGLGNSIVPQRLFNRPQIVVVDFIEASSGN